MRHGTWSCYCNKACRCELCRAAAALYHRTRLQHLRAQAETPEPCVRSQVFVADLEHERRARQVPSNSDIREWVKRLDEAVNQ